MCVQRTYFPLCILCLERKKKKHEIGREKELNCDLFSYFFSLSWAVNVLPLNGSFIASFTLLQKPFFFIIIYDGVFFLALSGNKNIY